MWLRAQVKLFVNTSLVTISITSDVVRWQQACQVCNTSRILLLVHSSIALLSFD